MARPILFLALVLLAIVGLASLAATTDAAATATAPSVANPVATAPSGGDDDVGTLDENEDAAPVGGPVPDGVFTNAPAPAPNGGAAAFEVSAIGGVAAAVAAFFL